MTSPKIMKPVATPATHFNNLINRNVYHMAGYVPNAKNRLTSASAVHNFFTPRRDVPNMYGYMHGNMNHMYKTQYNNIGFNVNKLNGFNHFSKNGKHYGSAHVGYGIPQINNFANGLYVNDYPPMVYLPIIYPPIASYGNAAHPKINEGGQMKGGSVNNTCNELKKVNQFIFITSVIVYLFIYGMT